MSNQENDNIWDLACERAEREGVSVDALREMYLEDVYHYLLTGQLPDNYKSICYKVHEERSRD